MGFTLSKRFGKNENTFLNKRTTYPPIKPAINAPKNPELTNVTSGFDKDANVVPAFATAPSYETNC